MHQVFIKGIDTSGCKARLDVPGWHSLNSGSATIVEMSNIVTFIPERHVKLIFLFSRRRDMQDKTITFKLIDSTWDKFSANIHNKMAREITGP